MESEQIRVVIVDDHPGVRAGIRSILSADNDIVVVGEGVNGAEAIKLARSKSPDVMLLDIELPLMRGDEVVRLIRDTQPTVKVLALSSYSDRLYIQGMMESGAVGYITKDEAPRLLLNAVRSIAQQGIHWVSPRASKVIRAASVEEQTLTRREVDILQLWAKGKSEAEIARALGIEEKRLADYLQLLMSKFGVDSLAGLRSLTRRIYPKNKPN